MKWNCLTFYCNRLHTSYRTTYIYTTHTRKYVKCLLLLYMYLHIYSMINMYIQGPPNTFFFGKCFKRKLLNIFSNFFFYLKVQSFRLIMENNSTQMAASAGHAVAYSIGPIFKHIIHCVQLYFTNGYTNIIL